MRIDRDVAGAHHANVIFNGEKITNCVEADEDEGWARCYVEGRDGRLRLHGDGPEYEIRRGDVRVEFDLPEWRQLAEAAIALAKVTPDIEILVKVKKVARDG